MKATKPLNSSEESSKLAEDLIEKCRNKRMTLCTAESCTGGLLSAKLTEISGSSMVFDRAFITYSNQAKMDMLKVDMNTLESFGAVSEQVANEMLLGALNHSGSDLSISITGIAGPGGGSPEKPVGTVCFAWGSVQNGNHCTRHFSGDRSAVREQAVCFALSKLLEFA